MQLTFCSPKESISMTKLVASIHFVSETACEGYRISGHMHCTLCKYCEEKNPFAISKATLKGYEANPLGPLLIHFCFDFPHSEQVGPSTFSVHKNFSFVLV